MIIAKINVLAIDKARLFKGEKGTYLDILLIETPNDKYGNDYMVVQSVSKEEREKGIKGNLLGNGKMVVKKGTPTPAPAAAKSTVEDDVAF
jgi:hypothetical protein